MNQQYVTIFRKAQSFNGVRLWPAEYERPNEECECVLLSDYDNLYEYSMAVKKNADLYQERSERFLRLKEAETKRADAIEQQASDAAEEAEEARESLELMRKALILLKDIRKSKNHCEVSLWFKDIDRVISEVGNR